MFQSLNTKIKHFLFNKSRCYVCDKNGVVESRKEAIFYYKNQLIIPRSMSVYKTISVANLHKSDLAAYIANQVVALSPFSSSGFYVRYKHDTAMLWIWDSEYELGLLKQCGLSYTDTDIMPETVLYKPEAEIALIPCKLGGYEGQIWKSAVLIGSRYWKTKPDDEQFLVFARSFNTAPKISDFQLASNDFQLLPWNEKQWSFLLKREFVESAVPAAAFSLLLLFLGWQVAKYVILSSLFAVKEAELAVKQVEVESTLSSRQQALKYNQQNGTLNSKVVQPQLSLIYNFVSNLTTDVADIRAWRFQKDNLVVEISASSDNVLDVSSLVSNLEKLEYISSVSVRRLGTLGNRWEISAGVSL